MAAIARGAASLAILGALGGPRFDHALANAWLLAHPALGGRPAVLLDGTTRVRLLAASVDAVAVELSGRPGDLVSLFPVGADALGVTTDGLAFRLRDEPLAFGPARGLSNVRSGPVARVSLRSGRLLVVETHAGGGSPAMSVDSPSGRSGPTPGWRTRDVVVTAVIGVAFGVVFWALNVVWPALTVLGPLQNLLYGPWLIPAVLAPLVIRRPGSGVFAEVVAASVSALLGSQWGVLVLLYGLVQGLAGEVPFLATRYRSFGWPVVLVAGVTASLAAWILDWVFFYPAVDVATQLVVGALMAVSGVVIVGGGSWFLARALRDAGVLGGFASGEGSRT